jgi:hypothetical protein
MTTVVTIMALSRRREVDEIATVLLPYRQFPWKAVGDKQQEMEGMNELNSLLTSGGLRPLVDGVVLVLVVVVVLRSLADEWDAEDRWRRWWRLH